MDELYKKAIKHGASDFGISNNIHKRYYVVYNERKINFGSKNGQTFIDHKNHDIRRAWIARHSKIKNNNNQYVINLKTSPFFILSSSHLSHSFVSLFFL